MRPISEKRRRMAADYMTRYDEYKQYVEERKASVMEAGAIRYDAVGGGAPISVVEMGVEQLEKINMDFRAQIVEKINKAWEIFCVLIEYSNMMSYDAQERNIVKAALWLNLTKPLANRYESFNRDTMPISRAVFYSYRRTFLNMLADKIGL